MAAAQSNGQAQAPGFAQPAPTVAEQEEEAAKPAAPGRARDARCRRGGRGGASAPPRAELREGNGTRSISSSTPTLVWTTLNGRRGGNTATNDRMMGYGPIALHVLGTSEVRFRDVSLKDLNRKTEPTAQVSSHFKMQQLNDFFYSWGASAGDINHDGVPDVDGGAVLLSGTGLYRTP